MLYEDELADNGTSMLNVKVCEKKTFGFLFIGVVSLFCRYELCQLAFSFFCAFGFGSTMSSFALKMQDIFIR
jgi:hypothetical protein